MERDSRKRAEALLAQMTATEKVGQLNQHLYGFRIYHVEDGKIIFVEQLYRAMTILNGGPYHHE